MGSGPRIGESIAYRNTPQILYGIGLPSVPKAPAPVNDGNNINNINNINNPPKQEAENAPGSPGGYNEVLARLMRNVGRKVWKTVERGEIEKLSGDVLGQIKFKPEVSEPERLKRREAAQDWLETFADAADEIQTKLKALSAYSVREMAMALKHVRDFDAKKANAQEPTERERAMAGELASLVDSLYDLSADLRAFSSTLKLSGKLQSRFNDMVLTLDSRATELNLLGRHLAEMADQVQGEEGKGSVVDFSKGMGGVMHGNYESVAGQDSLKVVAMTEKLDKMRNDQSSVKDLGEKMNVIKSDGKEDVKEKGGGKASKKLAQTMTPGMLAGLEKESREMVAKFARPDDFANSAVLAACFRFVKMIPNPLKGCLKDVWPETMESCPLVKKLIGIHRKCISALEDFVRSGGCRVIPDELTRSVEEYARYFNAQNAQETLNALLGELKALGGMGKLTAEGVKMRAALQKVRDAYPDDAETSVPLAKDLAKDLAKAVFGFWNVRKLFETYRKRLMSIGDVKDSSLRFRASDIPSVAVDGGKLSDHLLASMFGIDVKWIDPRLKDENIVETSSMGSGGVSDVTLIKYRAPDGGHEDRDVQIVFKPDFIASAGNTRLALSNGAYVGLPHALKLNIASNVIAKWLGCEDRLTKTSAVFHKNRLGVGMSLAKGKTALEASKAFEKGGKVTKLLGSKDENERKKGLRIVNDLMRQTTDLQWLDLLAGQGDRHRNNYFVDIDTAKGNVTVTGIDNDMCMPLTRTGLTRLKPAQEERESVRRELVKVFKSCGNRFKDVSPDEAADRMMREYFNKDGEIDFGRPDLPPELFRALNKAMGVRTLAVPTVMSQTMYDKLQEIAANRDGIINDLNGLSLLKNNVEAFANRLDDLLDLVKSGRILVVPEASGNNPTPWLSKDVQTRLHQSSGYYSKQQIPPKGDPYLSVFADASALTHPFPFRDFHDIMFHVAIAKAVDGENLARKSGYLKLPGPVKGFLTEVARMSYGVGKGGKKGGAGRIGLLEENGSLRVIKYNTHRSERLWLFGTNPATQAMKDSSNALRKKLVSIARMADLSPAKILQVRNLLGLKGDAETSDALLDRTAVAEVLEIIGGDSLWGDAQPPDNNWNVYASEKDMSFARVSSPDIDLHGHRSLGKRLEGIRSFSSEQFWSLLLDVKVDFLKDKVDKAYKEAKRRFNAVLPKVFGRNSIAKLVRDCLGAVDEQVVRKRALACLSHIWRSVAHEEAITPVLQRRLANECHALIADENYLLKTRYAVGEKVTVNDLQRNNVPFEALEDLVAERPVARGLLLVPYGLEFLGKIFKESQTHPEIALDRYIEMDEGELREDAVLKSLYLSSDNLLEKELVQWIMDNHRPKKEGT